LVQTILGKVAMLPNGFYKSLEGVDEIEIELICYGIPRSGSTLVYQLISGVYPQGVVKTHRYCSQRVKTTASYRDFRDVVVSLWRRSKSGKAHQQMTDAEVEKYATLCQARVKELDRYLERGGICLLRYEDFVDNPAFIFKAVEKTFGIIVDPQKVEELVREHSLEKNREVARRLRGFKEVDSATQIHGDHIYQAEVGGWRKFVRDRTAERLELLLRAPLTRYGYLD
jgi:hypothetical protein